MHGGIPHHAALGDGGPDLELRLDQHDGPGPGLEQRERCREQGAQPDEARIAHQRRGAGPDLSGVEEPRVAALHHMHPRVLPQRPGELPMAHIHRMHPRRAARQQHIREAAGGGADVEALAPLGREAEVVEAVGELHPAARDPRVVLAAQLERSALGHQVAGLVDAPLPDEDEPCHDEGLGAGAGVGEAALDEGEVGSLLGGLHG